MTNIKPSDNQLRADNQQGRLDPWYVVGFTDGEGCFSVSIFKNSTTRSGYQVFPEFVVTQGSNNLSVLKDLQSFFGCGKIYVNRRKDNHRRNLYRYCVRSIKDIRNIVIPFFNQSPLKTSKKFDFQTFCLAVEMISDGSHLKPDGLQRIRQLASTMNRQKPRDPEPSETTRQTRLDGTVGKI